MRVGRVSFFLRTGDGRGSGVGVISESATTFGLLLLGGSGGRGAAAVAAVLLDLSIGAPLNTRGRILVLDLRVAVPGCQRGEFGGGRSRGGWVRRERLGGRGGALASVGRGGRVSVDAALDAGRAGRRIGLGDHLLE